MATDLSVQTKQSQALARMLCGSSNLGEDEQMIGEWRVLVYDRAGRDILLPLFSVAKLKNMGITLHLLLHSDREPIPDASCIYFVEPTEDNLKRIYKDLKEEMYETFNFHFISPINRQKLEDLAQAALSTESVHLVQKIFDQYSNFVALEDQLFILRHQNRDQICYYNLNRSNITETEMHAAVDHIVDGLFAFLVTLGMIPFIRAQRGGIAEFVADKLDKKIRDNLRDSRNSLFQQEMGQLTFNRPVILLLDRNFDLMTPLSHSWTYQALINDVLETGLNQVAINVEGKKKQFYDLVQMDEFWWKYRFSPALPDVAEAVNTELEECQRQEDEIKSLQGGMNEDTVDLGESTAKLSSAVENLPQILEKKRKIDSHVNIATSLLDQIKNRNLDEFYRIKDKIVKQSKLEKNLKDYLKDEQFGDNNDKLRLLLTYLIVNQGQSENVEELTAALESLEVDTNAVRYVRKLNVSNKTEQKNQSSWGGKLGGLASAVSQTIGGKKQHCATTRALDSILNVDDEEYKYLDPKIMRPVEGQPKSRQPISQAILFIIGGGSYIEYQNLIEYESQYNKDKPAAQRLRCVYGATEMPRPTEFLGYLTQLGKESQ